VYTGRLVVLIEVPVGPREVAQATALKARVKTCCDVLVNVAGADWAGVWGWHGSRGLRAMCVGAAPLPAPVPIPVRAVVAAAGPRIVRRPIAPNAPASPSWEEVNNWLRYRTEKNVRVASLPQMLHKIGKTSNNMGRSVADWKYRYGWSALDIFQAKRKRGKPGGSEEYVGTARILRQIYDMKMR
jgi:hypothetical protein